MVSIQQQAVLHSRKGSLILEIVLSLAIVTLIASAMTTFVLSNSEGIYRMHERHIAAANSYEGALVAMKLLGREFDQVGQGSYDLVMNQTGWEFIPMTLIPTSTRSIEIDKLGPHHLQIASISHWNDPVRGEHEERLQVELYDWAQRAGSCGSLVANVAPIIINAASGTIEGVVYANDAMNPATISHLELQWEGVGALTKIQIGTSTVWTGNALSGDQVDVPDMTLSGTMSLSQLSMYVSDELRGNSLILGAHCSDGTMYHLPLFFES
jgi:hypothetical protein